MVVDGSHARGPERQGRGGRADESRKPSDRAAEIQQRLGAFDKLLEHRVRLAVCVLLSRYDHLSFSRLKELTGETDGSLGAHLRRLEDEGYVRVKKQFVDRKPVSWYALAPAGRAALAAHLEALDALIRRADAGRTTR